jgi:hypothetical protein
MAPTVGDFFRKRLHDWRGFEWFLDIPAMGSTVFSVR